MDLLHFFHPIPLWTTHFNALARGTSSARKGNGKNMQIHQTQLLIFALCDARSVFFNKPIVFASIPIWRWSIGFVLVLFLGLCITCLQWFGRIIRRIPVYEQEVGADSPPWVASIKSVGAFARIPENLLSQWVLLSSCKYIFGEIHYVYNFHGIISIFEFLEVPLHVYILPEVTHFSIISRKFRHFQYWTKYFNFRENVINSTDIWSVWVDMQQNPHRLIQIAICTSLPKPHTIYLPRLWLTTW